MFVLYESMMTTCQYDLTCINQSLYNVLFHLSISILKNDCVYLFMYFYFSVSTWDCPSEFVSEEEVKIKQKEKKEANEDEIENAKEKKVNEGHDDGIAEEKEKRQQDISSPENTSTSQSKETESETNEQPTTSHPQGWVAVAAPARSTSSQPKLKKSKKDKVCFGSYSGNILTVNF